MTICLKTCFLVLCTLMSLGRGASADTPLDSFEVVAVTPSQAIRHRVNLQGPFDDDLVVTLLNGPEFFAQAVGLEQKSFQEPRAFLNGYKIAKPTAEPRRTVTLRDPLRGNKKFAVTIKNSAYLLTPAQRLTTGSPSPVPDELNCFKAYRILDAPEIDKKLRLTGTLGPELRTASKAVYLCLPCEQQHHEEHFPVKNSQGCLLVYELMPHSQNTSITTLDQFGTNKLEATSHNWLCVATSISQTK